MGATDVRRYYDDEGNDAVVYLGEPIHAGYTLIPRARLVGVTSPWSTRGCKWAHSEFCRPMGATQGAPRIAHAAPATAWRFTAPHLAR